MTTFSELTSGSKFYLGYNNSQVYRKTGETHAIRLNVLTGADENKVRISSPMALVVTVGH